MCAFSTQNGKRKKLAFLIHGLQTYINGVFPPVPNQFGSVQVCTCPSGNAHKLT